jgi:hypothetical protein
MKARRKILKRKEATAVVQAIRRGDSPIKTAEVTTIPKTRASPKKKGYHEIDVAY